MKNPVFSLENRYGASGNDASVGTRHAGDIFRYSTRDQLTGHQLAPHEDGYVDMASPNTLRKNAVAEEEFRRKHVNKAAV